MQSGKAILLVAICACGGGTPTPPAGPTPPPTPAVAHPQQPVRPPGPDPHTMTNAPEAPFAVPDAHEPEFYPPAWHKVGIGQTISFQTAVIDQDLDETRVDVSKMPASATFDAITQTITWTPTKADAPRGTFELSITQPGRHKQTTRSFTIDVVPRKQPVPVAPAQSPVIETLLMIRQPARLAKVNKDWPLDRLLEVGARTFQLQLSDAKRAALKTPLDGKTAYQQMLAGLAKTHQNPRLDPTSPQFDKAAFGSPRDWKMVAFRPRIDKAWTELRVVYQAVKAREPVFAMFRLRPVVEYVPPLPRPPEELAANNQLFLGMVAKHLMKNGGPDPRFVKDVRAHARAVSALMTELMTFDDTKGSPTAKPYRHGYMIGIAFEARMGGGSKRAADGGYASGDGWGWSAQKPFPTADGTSQAYVNIGIPGFWTAVKPSADQHTWDPVCAPRYNPDDPSHAPGYQALCRKPLGFVDLPEVVAGKVGHGAVDANNLYFEYKKRFEVADLALEDGRRDLGEENGMTCAQCHIRNFGMHDYGDPANVDPKQGTPKGVNHALPTLNFQIITTDTWQPFTLEFLQHQECRGKERFTEALGAASAKGLTCPLAKT